MNPHIVRWIKKNEGLRMFPYKDTATPPRYTIGFGRNLSDNGISPDEAELMLSNDLAKVWMDAKKLDFFDSLDDVRQAVVLDLIYNMGIARFKNFYGTIEAIRARDWPLAATRLGQSAYAMQVRERANRNMGALRTGDEPDYYRKA